jgi:hypothetical protein
MLLQANGIWKQAEIDILKSKKIEFKAQTERSDKKVTM